MKPLPHLHFKQTTINNMPTSNQERKFVEYLQDQTKPDSTILSTLIDWIADELEPEEVFREKQLIAWAEANGYVKE